MFKFPKQYLEDKAYEADKATPIDMSSFVGYFIKTKLVYNYNYYPRKELFIYADDLIYSLYWNNRGYKHLFVPQIKFIHDTDTLHSNQGLISPIWKNYYMLRNGIELYRQMAKWSALPYAMTKYLQLRMQKKNYPKHQHSIYVSLINQALFDGIKQDFSKLHTDILKLTEDSKNTTYTA